MISLVDTWGTLTDPDQRLEDREIPDEMDDLILPYEIYPESFKLVSLLETCQEWAVKGGTWRTLRVPDQRQGRLGHS